MLSWLVVQAARKRPKQALWAGVDRLAGTGTGLQDERQAVQVQVQVKVKEQSRFRLLKYQSTRHLATRINWQRNKGSGLIYVVTDGGSENSEQVNEEDSQEGREWQLSGNVADNWDRSRM